MTHALTKCNVFTKLKSMGQELLNKFTSVSLGQELIRSIDCEQNTVIFRKLKMSKKQSFLTPVEVIRKVVPSEQ